MDVLKIPLPQESVRNSLGVGLGDEKEPSGGVVNYPNLSPKTGSNTPKKRANNKLPDMTRTPPAASPTVVRSWKSVPPLPPFKSDTKYKTTPLKTNISSPKASPRRKRKRYLSNPNNQTAPIPNTTSDQNGVVVQTQSPTSIKRRRRRSASLSINGTNTSPKENKNQENIQIHEGRNISPNILKQQSQQQKHVRTPTKRNRTQSGNANDAATSPKLPTTAGASPPKNTPSKGPPNTTVWGWSPIRGKFKPKSVEYQNGLLIEHPEADVAQLPTSFKSKWQSVSFVIYAKFVWLGQRYFYISTGSGIAQEY